MRMPWKQTKSESALSSFPSQSDFFDTRTTGEPLLVSVALLDEDSDNPRTEFPDTDLDELAEDIGQHGVLQPIVVHPADSAGRHRIHFGAKRLRAARRAGLQEVPVVVRALAADPYAQVAENQKRHGLSPLDLARFIKWRSDAGDSNATIARRLGMNPTTVAHHLTLLDLPPQVDQALRSGQCTSPRALHELTKLHEEQPEQVKALLTGDTEITRTAIAALRAGAKSTSATTLLAQGNAACDRLERILARLNKAERENGEVDLAAFRRRIADLASGCA